MKLTLTIRPPSPEAGVEEGCSHVCEMAVEGQETKVFVGNSAEGALRQAIDHMTFCATAYAWVLLPEPLRTDAKAVQLEREMAAAGFVYPVIFTDAVIPVAEEPVQENEWQPEPIPENAIPDTAPEEVNPDA